MNLLPARTARRGFTIAEAMVATVIVACMAVTALNTVAFSVHAQGKAGDRAVGGLLAQAMIDEIVSQAYQDPNQPTTVLGPEPGEATNSRMSWNDVDDYNGWSESPLQNKDSSIIPNTNGWKRSVVVAWVSPTTFTVSLTETGCKQITVTVSHNGFPVATRVALRTNAP